MEIFKFPNSKTVKVTFSNQEIAANSLVRGMKLFNLQISSTDITQEDFIEIDQCFRCFKLNDHKTGDCDSLNNVLICSKCSGTGHHFRECSMRESCCINCKQNHPATCFSCPRRKEIVECIRKNKGNYTSAVKKNVSMSVLPVNLNTDTITDRYVKSLLCLMIARRKEIESPGTFESTLSYLQSENNVPKFTMGNVSLKNFDLTPKENMSLNYSIKNQDAGESNDNLDEEIDQRERSAGSSEHMGGAEAGRSMDGKAGEESQTYNTGGPSTRQQSTSHPESMRSRACVGLTAGVKPIPNINIVKNGTVKLDSANLESNFRKGKIKFECSTGLSQEQCLEYLKGNLIECKLAICKCDGPKTKPTRALRK